MLTLKNAATKVSATAFGTAMLTVGVLLTSATASDAAIIALGDSHSPFGTNTIANLGFNLVNVTDSAAPNGTTISSLLAPNGITVTFSPETGKRTVPDGWSTWSNGYTGPVYSDSVTTSLTLAFSSPITAFDFFAEPNPFDFRNITATTASGATLTQSVNGLAGAKYFGFYSDNATDEITSITISSSDNFAIGQMRLAATPVPTPALLPGLIGMGIATFRKRKGEAAQESSKA
ncbi:PTPA-CTERM sorting domain-containing protein [Leptolyngbya sp. FACHB-711]|uniref:PTPA-CTERM sorting domain-containing protein n=1 Tax=Leptolyngbya sp. FACHB-711 TaxID=2692813 RepID=UPI001687C6B1|nr:PTPA-CTERM sorting domain-containing protein [Leptolyngbya sp. FACHB-711]MBD1848725.1 PTPA-CTERM sorting domain-containing protein [Cyanobacteria bacterium FACHB-502]MBD2025935.1 PTPA-CTERM sorting domain-containing protein [Leptolyngbya sp. FACHB-711]